MLVVNFFGAPGAGKSTVTSGLFYEMKKVWLNVEMVNEFAKELVWAGTSHLLSEQHLVFAQQEHRLNRLRNKVDIIISDAPLLLSAFYRPQHYPQAFADLVFAFFSTYTNLNFVVRRSHVYSAVGRLQNEEESDAIAARMERFLHRHHIPFYFITANDANPVALLAWMVEQGFVSLPEFLAEDRERLLVMPEGWTRPELALPPDVIPEDTPLEQSVTTVGRAQGS